MTPDHERNTITLRALEGAPLAEDNIRGMVVATAHAIAERNGVTLLYLRTDEESITATLACSRLAAIGFASELRRLTERWYRQHTGANTLWGGLGEPPHLDGDDDNQDWGLNLDDWKNTDDDPGNNPD